MAVQFNGKSYKLKYLFGAEFEDGCIYQQTKEDKSKIDPEKSAFFDIINSGKKVKSFWLKRFGEKHEVDLLTGEFTVNGVKFMTHDELVNDFRLVYYRRHYHDFKKDVETDHRIEYHFGWQTTFNGQNIKRIIILK